MNVVPVWQDCINGTGVTVGVVDGGIMWRDPDISLKMVSMNFLSLKTYRKCRVKIRTNIFS